MELYQPLTEHFIEFSTVIVRTRNLSAALPLLLKAANGSDAKVTARIKPMRLGFDQRIRRGRVAAMSISALGAAALLVALVGLAGLISYSLTQKTKEIGIRMALGAPPLEALRVGITELVPAVAIGMVLGLTTAAALAQGLRSFLYGISTVDPLAYGTALTLFTLLGALAAVGSLLRAAQVDPATSLRHD